MNTELLSVLDFLEREKGIDREILIQAVESSLVSAARKNTESIAQNKDLVIKIDRKTGDIKAFTELTVVENSKKVTPDEISLSKAKKINSDTKVGETIAVEVTTRDFGRIAAQTAKQIIIQKIREAERDLVYNEFKDRIGDITMGTVRRRDRGNISVDLGKAEATLPHKEQCPGENYRIGDRIRAFVVDVKLSSKGPEILLSRTHVGLIKRLFELEVPEIAEGTVTIKEIVREAGFRTKIAVTSSDPKVDPIGACVGMRGSRVKNIVRELENEKLDIIKWEPEIKDYIRNALNPAKLEEVIVNEEEKRIKILVPEDQLSIAIGKRGQNVRLASKLTGWDIDIRKAGEGETPEEKQTTKEGEKTSEKEKALETAEEIPAEEEVKEEKISSDTTVKEKAPVTEEEPEEIVEEGQKLSVSELTEKLEIPEAQAEALLEAKFYNIEKITTSKLASLAKIPALTKAEAKKIKTKAQELIESASEQNKQEDEQNEQQNNTENPETNG